MPANLVATLTALLRDVAAFAQHLSGVTLRNYHIHVARAICASIIQRRGDTIVIMFPRQSGKNELQAQIETYVMTLMQNLDAELVKVSPTWKPQSLNAMRRLERVLKRNLIAKDRWGKESGYIYKVGSARQFFLSGEPHASTVGHTASTLLQCDEAQDVRADIWDKKFLPMAASTNATRVLWGTAWTSKTLLARELTAARAAEARDGRQRAFTLTADDVGREVPEYAAFVAEQVGKMGRNHPLIRTQYYCEEIDAEGGLFPPTRRALMRGDHGWRTTPQPGALYAFTLDVAGEDETADLTGELSNPGRDATALTVFEIDLASLNDPLMQAPTYRAVCRYSWTGIKHPRLYGQIKALADIWQPRHLVADATGVGAGLVSFLDKALPSVLIPFVFSARSKSDLGWNFLSVIESGRYRDHGPTPAEPPDPAARAALRSILATRFDASELRTLCFDLGCDADALPAAPVPEFAANLIAALERRDSVGNLLTYVVSRRPDVDWTPAFPADAAAILTHQATFWRELEHVAYTAAENQTLRWSVPDGTRAPDGTPVHDDWVLSAALVSQLDTLTWGRAESAIARPPDRLAGLGDVY